MNRYHWVGLNLNFPYFAAHRYHRRNGRYNVQNPPLCYHWICFHHCGNYYLYKIVLRDLNWVGCSYSAWSCFSGETPDMRLVLHGLSEPTISFFWKPPIRHHKNHMLTLWICCLGPTCCGKGVTLLKRMYNVSILGYMLKIEKKKTVLVSFCFRFASLVTVDSNIHWAKYLNKIDWKFTLPEPDFQNWSPFRTTEWKRTRKHLLFEMLSSYVNWVYFVYWSFFNGVNKSTGQSTNFWMNLTTRKVRTTVESIIYQLWYIIPFQQ